VFIVLRKETAAFQRCRPWKGVETDHFSGVLGDDCGASDNLLDGLAMTMSPRVPAVYMAMG